MAVKVAPDAVMDAAFDFVDLADVIRVCSVLDSTPTHAEIVTATLASTAITPGTDFTKSDGDTNGRKVRVVAKPGVSITATGTAEQIALTTTSGSVVRYVTTCTSQLLTSGGTVDIPAWDIEIADPT